MQVLLVKLMVHVDKLAFNGDPNVGLYGVASDKFCILGRSVPRKVARRVEEVLHVPVVQASVYGTSLVGIFIAVTSDTVLVPDVIFKRELEELRKGLKGIAEVKTLKTEHTALANNILCNDKVAFVSPELSKKEIEDIKKSLNLKVVQMSLADLQVPGSAAVFTNQGGIFNSNLSDSEIKKVEKLVSFEIGLGTVNMGSPIVGSGVIANSKGFVVGALSSGYEISRIDESLGFLK